MFCNYCGSQIDSQSRQCPKCGRKVDQAEGGVGFWDLAGKPNKPSKPESSADTRIIERIVRLQERQLDLEKRISTLMVLMMLLLVCVVAIELLAIRGVREVRRDIQFQQEYYERIIRERETEPPATTIPELTWPEETMDMEVDGTAEWAMESSYHSGQQPQDIPVAETEPPADAMG